MTRRPDTDPPTRRTEEHLMANPHVLNAFKALAAADPKTDAELLASAQISATLAIAEELRTANLIAIGSPVAMPCMDADTALSDAYRRLGLRKDDAR